MERQAAYSAAGVTWCGTSRGIFNVRARARVGAPVED